MVDAIKLRVPPSQTGELVLTDGAEGMGLIVTRAEDAAPEHCATVAVTEYEPALAKVTLLITGFCDDEVKPPGPVQLYVAPGTDDACRLNTLPAQIGELVDTTGAGGNGFTCTCCVA